MIQGYKRLIEDNLLIEIFSKIELINDLRLIKKNNLYKK